MSLFGAWIVALALTALVSASITGYALVAAVFTKNARSSLVLGVGFYGTAILVTGLWSGYNLQVQTLMVAVGLAALSTYWKRRWELLSPSGAKLIPRGLDRWWLVFPIVYGLTRLFSCGLPQQHSDPLYYHLAAPKLWVELGRIQLTPEHPSYAQAGLWEGFYGLPQIWLGTKGIVTHVIVQLYGQWMHCLWGEVGSVLVAAAILRRLAPPLKERPGLSVFLGWLCAALPGYEWLGCLAKNDYVLALFCLAAVLEALEGNWLLAGLSMGFAYSTKVLAAWAAIAILALIPWRKWHLYLAGAAAGAAAFLFRNLYWTGNPFFPTLDDRLGPRWLSRGFVEHNASYGGALQFDPRMFHWLHVQLFQGALPKVLLAGGAVALIVEVAARRKAPGAGARRGRWLVFIAIQLALVLLMLRPLADGRYAGVAAMSAVLFAVGAVAREAARHRKLWRYGAIAVLPLGLLINSPIDELWKIPRDYLFAPATLYLERFHSVYGMHLWANTVVPPEDKILFLAEKQNFYLDRPFDTVSEMRSWEDALSPLKSPEQLFAKARELGYRYVHFSPQAGGFPAYIRPYWPRIEAMASRAVYRDTASLVFDLKRP